MNELLKFGKVVIGSLTCLLVAVVLTGCSETDIDGLPDGKQPMTFTASVDGLTTTRATTDNTWTGGEEVAMRIGSEVKKYTAAASGVLSAASGVTPWYWQNTSETKNIEAWHPYNSGTKPTTFTVTPDQSTTGYQQSDLIYTPATTISYVSPKLTFRHLPVRVAVNLKAGNGVTEAEVQNATVTLVNQHLTSGTIATDWSVVQVASGNSTIVPNPLATSSAGSHKTVQALVVPQKTTTAAQFIRITIGGQEFVYSTALNLVAGTQYTYTITVSRNGINVMASGAQAWAGSETPITSKTFATGYAPSDLKIGDYYYSDGTSSDGGYREYTDGTKTTLPIMPVLTDASGNARTVVGIVLKVGKDVNGDWKDDCNYKTKDGGNMSTIHGYVLGLYDAKDGSSNTSFQWGSYGTKVDHNDMNREKETGFYGYKNTNAIKAFATDKSKNLQTDFPATYYATVGYEASFPAPANSSGWFLPSGGQGKYWYNNRAVILASIRKATGADSYNWQDYYWSSSEYDGSPADRAWNVYFRNGNVDNVNKYFGLIVRSIFAF